MKRYVHVGTSLSTSKRTEDIERVLDRHADDWFRYAPNCWILWTDRPIANISRAIRRELKRVDEVLVLPINIEIGYAGFMDPSVWEWLKRPLS